MGTFFTRMNQLNQQDLFWYILSDLLQRFWFARTKCHGSTVKQTLIFPLAIMSFLLLPCERPKNSPSVQANSLCFLVWLLRVEHVSPCSAAGWLQGTWETWLQHKEGILCFQPAVLCCQEYTSKRITRLLLQPWLLQKSPSPVHWGKTCSLKFTLTSWQNCCFPSCSLSSVFLALVWFRYTSCSSIICISQSPCSHADSSAGLKLILHDRFLKGKKKKKSEKPLLSPFIFRPWHSFRWSWTHFYINWHLSLISLICEGNGS